MKKTSTSALTLVLLLIIIPTSSSLPYYYQLRTLTSLSTSLMHRVANARAARGDAQGAQRARRIAEAMESGVWSVLRRVGWDYVWNYAWGDGVGDLSEFGGVVADVAELLRLLNELTQSGSDRGYQRVVEVGNSVILYLVERGLSWAGEGLRRFCLDFEEHGAIREVVMGIKKEVQGDLLKDCIDVGIGDLKGLVQVVKGMALQFSRQNNLHENSDL
ncbi:hypothetical protein Scep_011860 [Stephania cephalantha]|uniref:Uncharacterized protein n=1 Tax=Stephania cephalantha TaxID=152367 RepID=A0AAP0JG65_9MAGN